MKKPLSSTLFFALALSAAVLRSAHAQGAPVPTQQPQVLAMVAENLNANDERHRKQTNPQAVLVGDVVRWRLTFTNLRADSVKNVQFKDKIPDGMRYVAASAKGDRRDVLVEFSIDKGLSYSTQPMIDVVEAGIKVRRPAPASMYTDVRWSVQGWVKPNAQVIAEFRAELGATTPTSNAGQR